MKVMITGGAGFIGSHLCEYFLQKNHEVVAITKQSTKNLDGIPDIDIEKTDVTNSRKIEHLIMRIYAMLKYPLM